MTESTGDLSGGPRSPRRSGVAEGLTRSDILAAIQHWRAIGREQFLASFGSSAAQKYVIVEGTDEIDAIALLRGARTMSGLEVAPHYRGDRRNVADPLRALGFFVDNIHSDLEAPLENDPSAYSSLVHAFLGHTDGITIRSYRREQRILRGALGIGSGDGDRLHECGICGVFRPEQLVVAAHIKRRAYCAESERRDLPSVAMPACTLGCDSLFEYGYLAVADGGQILVYESEGVTMTCFEGETAPAWSPSREPYFRWHRHHVFRGTSAITRPSAGCP